MNAETNTTVTTHIPHWIRRNKFESSIYRARRMSSILCEMLEADLAPNRRKPKGQAFTIEFGETGVDDIQFAAVHLQELIEEVQQHFAAFLGD